MLSLGVLHDRLRNLHRDSGTAGPGRGGRVERLEFHLLLALDTGLLWHMVDFSDFALAPGTWLWVRPGQVQQFSDLSEAQGTAVLFQADLLDRIVAAQVRLDDPFAPTVWPVAGASGAAVTRILNELGRAHRDVGLTASTRSAILRHLLSALLLRLTDRNVPVGTVAPEHTETFQRFRAAVEKDFARARDVGHYAHHLGYAPRTLTRASQAAAGVGAKAFIDRRVILEARRLLAHGEDPVVVIAYRLGFPDASSFGKFFTQRTGSTPAAFRHRFRTGRRPRPRRGGGTETAGE
ncbi:helix-turn-helix domain-containing protein [Isoptericola halotolerans]|uniref:AraC-like DNA-binding protein n=1 Tax=Isoptericola halotolerans TaxID=300560 RepID=A0ABX1ZY51_9MICO|nr:AraC-like DNA-binding protein [Isoptericola halotolerans]